MGAVLREAGKNVVVLDSTNGKVVFDSQAAGVVRLLDKFVLPESGNLLVFGFREGTPKTTMFCFDVASGKRQWANDELGGKMGKLASTLGALIQASTGELANAARSGPSGLVRKGKLGANRTNTKSR